MTAPQASNMNYGSSVDPKLAALVEDLLVGELERLFRGRFTFEDPFVSSSVDGNGDPFLNVRISFAGHHEVRRQKVLRTDEACSRRTS